MTARKRANWYEDSVDCEINKEKMWKQKPEEQKSNFWSYVFSAPIYYFIFLHSLPFDSVSFEVPTTGE